MMIDNDLVVSILRMSELLKQQKSLNKRIKYAKESLKNSLNFEDNYEEVMNSIIDYVDFSETN